MKEPVTADGRTVSRRNYLKLGAGTALSLPLAGCFGFGDDSVSDTSGAAQSDDTHLTIIKDGTLVPIDPDVGVQANADVLIEDGEIVEIADTIEESDAEIVDASDAIVLPGFVNSHLHTWQASVRGTTGDWTFSEYLELMLGDVSSRYEPEDAYLGNLFGAVEQLHTGTTTVLDWFHIANSPDHTDRAIDGLEDAGIRSVFAHGPPGDDGDTWWEASTEPHPADIERLHDERFPANDGLLTLAMGIRGPDYATDEVVEEDIALGRELDIPISMHIGSLGPGGVYDLEELDLLGPDLNYVHGNRFEREEFELIGDSGGSISITPEVEMQMGMGMPVLGEAIAADATPTLGVDITSNVSGDMFTQTRMALQAQRALDKQPAVERNEQTESVSLDARRALELATIEGARALGMEDRIGSITPGKRADIVLLRTDDITTAPVHDPIETAVFQAGTSTVDTVLVDGRIVKRDGVVHNEAIETHWSAFEQSGTDIIDESVVEPGRP
ncbi:amidohydrolase family protein [Halostagnicola bangensis]